MTFGLFIDTNPCDHFKSSGEEVGINEMPLEVGRCYYEGKPLHLKGIISEIRPWNKELSRKKIGKRIKSNESGLVSHWKSEEKEGKVTPDAACNNQTFIKGAW